MIGISYKDFDKFGCPSCGSDAAKSNGCIMDGEQMVTCRHCEQKFYLIPDERIRSNVRISTGRKNDNGDFILEHVISIQHPRKGFDKWHYTLPDIRPENGEYFTPRGIGYDLAGFVKCREAGERLLEIVKKVLNNSNPDTYLDYRESEPYWIQFKFSPKEFDIEKIYSKTKDTKIITEEIIQFCKL